ncbi:MAG: class I SAM-dependent methyltransferase [Lachnospiraceae bacterium]|nr:class I SAM-dependent methyltransferase [Lachnospiraceae bacterium]
MGNELNEQEKKVIEQYAGFPEWKRLSYTKAHETEFIITMHYLHKYLTPGAKIADVGAGGGVYTKTLADEGYKVDAVELTPEYVNHMKEEFAGNGHIRVFEGNAKDLHFLNDNEYDLVLAMGPVYSMKDFEDRKRACKEALRIAKPGAPVFIAFCLQDAPLIHEIFMSDDPASEITGIGYDREKALVTDNTGSSRLLDTIGTVDELIDAVCKENGAQKVCRFAQEGISQIISKNVNSMSEKSYAEWIQYLIATAERSDLMGFSDHIVQVLRKL